MSLIKKGLGRASWKVVVVPPSSASESEQLRHMWAVKREIHGR